MLSIIIITKNEEKMLPRLLDSIKCQDFNDYEIIVSDAKSTDKTRSIAKKYGCRIVEGGLPSKGRNNGAKAARGDILLFLDADVILPPKFLLKNIKEFNKKNLVFATVDYIPLSHKIIDKILHHSYNAFARTIQYISPHAARFCIFCKKNVFFKIGGFNENIRFAEDHALVSKYKGHGKFRILNSVPLLVDVRRLDKEGRIGIIKKFVFADLYRLIKGEIKNCPFDYNMQGVNIKKLSKNRKRYNKKIAIFTDTFLPLTDGVVTFVTNISKELADKGYKIYIICPKYDIKKEFKYKNVKIIRIPGIPAFFYKGFKFTSFYSSKLYNFLKNEKIDIIHMQTPIFLGIQAIIISKLLKIPLIGTYHTNIADPNYLKHIKLNSPFMQKLSWEYLRSYYNRCDLITCPSETTKKDLLDHGFKKNIISLSNGIKFDIFDNSNWRKVKEKYNKKGKILLFVGRIAHEKNIPYLLDCFSLVLKKIPETKLLIVGDGPEYKEISELIKKKGLLNNVIMTGGMEYEKFVKSSIIKASDLFVTASTTETQGISTMEAQANGVVAIGINEGGIKDLIKNNYNGFLLEVGDKEGFANKVIELLTNDLLYKRMQTNTLKEIEKHRFEKIIKSWEKVYKDLIKNGM